MDALTLTFMARINVVALAQTATPWVATASVSPKAAVQAAVQAQTPAYANRIPTASKDMSVPAAEQGARSAKPAVT